MRARTVSAGAMTVCGEPVDLIETCDITDVRTQPATEENGRAKRTNRDAGRRGRKGALCGRPSQHEDGETPGAGEQRAESGERRAESGQRTAEGGERTAESGERRAIWGGVAGSAAFGWCGARSAVWRWGDNESGAESGDSGVDNEWRMDEPGNPIADSVGSWLAARWG